MDAYTEEVFRIIYLDVGMLPISISVDALLIAKV